jgi:hypothetical protein
MYKQALMYGVMDLQAVKAYAVLLDEVRCCVVVTSVFVCVFVYKCVRGISMGQYGLCDGDLYAVYQPGGCHGTSKHTLVSCLDRRITRIV